MAKANTNDAPAPELPEHPFIVPGKAEDTYIQIEGVLAFIQEYVQGQTYVHGHSSPPDHNHLFGFMHVVGGVRDAVKYLSHLDAVPTGNVTKLEVGDE